MRHLYFSAILLAAIISSLTSCTVYAPMQPTMPLLTHQCSIEAGASIQPNGRLEGNVAYSPLRYTFLSVGGTVCPKLGEETYLITKQYEVGIGGYYPLGASWLVNGMAGYGRAQNTRGYRDLGFPLGSTFNEYSACYDKYFIQLGVARKFGNFQAGFTYRLTNAEFSSLTNSRLGALPLHHMLRHELLAFARCSWPNVSERWALQYAFGLSVSGTSHLDDNQSYPDYGVRAYHANRNLLPAFYVSLGAVYQPKW